MGISFISGRRFDSDILLNLYDRCLAFGMLYLCAALVGVSFSLYYKF